MCEVYFIFLQKINHLDLQVKQEEESCLSRLFLWYNNITSGLMFLFIKH